MILSKGAEGGGHSPNRLVGGMLISSKLTPSQRQSDQTAAQIMSSDSEKRYESPERSVCLIMYTTRFQSEGWDDDKPASKTSRQAREVRTKE